MVVEKDNSLVEWLVDSWVGAMVDKKDKCLVELLVVYLGFLKVVEKDKNSAERWVC